MSDLRVPPGDVVAIDIETVSLHPSATIWEFGAVRRYANGGHQTWSVMLEHPDLRHADPAALAVGRFYERHPHASRAPGVFERGGAVPVTDQVLRARSAPRTVSSSVFARLVAKATHDAVLLVNNASFDVPRLDRLLRTQGLVPGWFYRPVDVVDMARGLLAPDAADEEGSPPESWSSAWMASRLGVVPSSASERHTALGDARWVLRVYDAVRGVDNPAGAVGSGS